MFITKKGLEELIQKRLGEQEREYQDRREMDFTFRNIRDDYDRLSMRVANLEREVWKHTPTNERTVQRDCMGS